MAFRDYILDRFWLKLFSFILATLIWFTVQSQRNIQGEARFTSNPFHSGDRRDFSRVIRVDTLPTNRKLFKMDPQSVTITISGKSAVLDAIQYPAIQPYVIVPETPDSPAPYPIEVRNLPPKVTLERISPPNVMVGPMGPG
ncbi:MAG TPA: YbbR-like domain-containing protein [Candidatus Binatia bacterium]|nr:YbbR-like domain-containing protein [Candidatus Binatia bacterium]